MRRIHKEYNVAVIGATGNAGMETIRILEERKFPINEIHCIASNKSVGRAISFCNKNIKVQAFDDVDFSKIDIAFFCAGSAVSKKYADHVTSCGCVIIDKTSYFRLNPKVPLIIPEVNLSTLKKGAPLGIISTPNCVAVPLAMTLKALSTLSPIKRAVISTYQSVSGAGKQAIDELYQQSKAVLSATSVKYEVFPKQIAFNVIPSIGLISGNGICEEEEKISSEICKILKSDIKLAVTCVRVPVFICHSLSVACEFTKPVEDSEIFSTFENFDNIVILDRREDLGNFATPLDINGEDSVYVSRIRRDTSVKSGLLYWVVSDNLRKGAALNAIQIAESMIELDSNLKSFKKVV